MGADNNGVQTRRAARRLQKVKGRKRRSVAVAAVLTLLLGCGYVVADIYDVAPGMLTSKVTPVEQFPEAKQAIAAKSVVTQIEDVESPNAGQTQALVKAFASATGVGKDFSLVIADDQGKVIVERNQDALREPASTMKTLTSFAASQHLDMSSTLDTEVYLDDSASTPTLTLKGNGDMMLGSGANDASHVNGRAGLTTLAQRTAAALRQQGVNTVAFRYDDSLFGSKRLPDHLEENNPDLAYASPMASMAIDLSRNWTGWSKPSNPDVESAFPPRSSKPAADVANTFVKLLAGQGIKVTGGVTSGTAPSSGDPIASVSSAHLSEIMSYMLRNSDNTEAELFGRLLALKTGQENSPEGAAAAVKQTLADANIDVSKVTVADCSGLSPGSRLTASVLAQVQSALVHSNSSVSAAAEGLAVSGLSGTALSHDFPDSADGLIRLKTGTLSDVTSMTGNVSRTKGGTLVFAVIVNNPTNTWEAIHAIDTLVGKLPQL